MTQTRSSREPALLALATLFIALTAAYGISRIAWTHWQPGAWLGLTFDEATLELATVDPHGPAGRAGLKPFDRIVDVNDHPATDRLAVHDQIRRVRVGQPVRFTVELAGLRDKVTREFLAERRPAGEWPEPAAVVGRALAASCPLLLFLVTALALLSHSDDRRAWCLALIFAGVLATAPLDPIAGGIPPWLRGPAYSYKVLFEGVAPAVLAHLFSVFPRPSPLDDRYPQAKTWWLAGSAALAIPASLSVLVSPELARGREARVLFGLALLSWIAAVLWSIVSGVWSAMQSTSEDVRRRLRLGAYGALAASLPALALWKVDDLSLWIVVPAVTATLLLPLAWIRSMLAPENPDAAVLFRRGARLLLVGRGHVGLSMVLAGLIGVSAAGAALGLLGHLGSGQALTAGIAAGLAVAPLFLWGEWRLHSRFRDRIERALFRDEYESRRVLSELAAQLQVAPSAAELARNLERQLHLALRPTSLAIYLECGGDCLKIERGIVPEGFEEISLGAPLLPAEAAGPKQARSIRNLDRVIELGADCLVPLVGRGTGLLGLIVLGPRRSREPYSDDDKRSLGLIGGDAANALRALRGPAAPAETAAMKSAPAPR